MARVLLIENFPPVRDVLVKILRHLGHEVDAHGDVDTAGPVTEYDLVVLDWVAGAADFARSVKAAHPSLPILVISGLPDSRDTALAAGADRVLFKPFIIAELRSVMRELLTEEPSA